jgi:peptidoglycan hydrolase CwlO-like protein
MTETIAIQRLAYLGSFREPATLEFSKKITVICGASDTGKSFTVESINFALGKSPPLRDIPQRVGYDRIRLQLSIGSETSTIERSVEGGDFRLSNRTLRDSENTDSAVLRAQHKHGNTSTLSGWLLNKIGLHEKRIKKNKAGATTSLSFRNLIDFVLVTENNIIKEQSPFQTGQYTTATGEYAVLKLLLTGVDDSALTDSKIAELEDHSTTAKLEFLDVLIREAESEIADVNAQESELLEQYAKLGSTIESVQTELEQASSNTDDSLRLRRELQTEILTKQNRLDDSLELLGRFKLLYDHYESDLRRLESVSEAGSIFAYLDQGPCPVCGTPPAEQKHLDFCDGDVSSVVAAANSEIEKIHKLKSELDVTRSDLESERDQIVQDVASSNEKMKLLNNQIQRLLAPALSRTQFSFRELADKRASVGRSLDLYQRLNRLKEQRDELLVEEQEGGGSQETVTDLSKSTLDALSRSIEKILAAWHFPSSDRVFFDEKTRDFIIGGKPRGSYGKGFRAITHAAITIGLMQYCLKRKLPHPGFVILDSPLLAYWKPEGKNDSLAGTDLKERFFEYLCSNQFAGQAIIIENEHPPLNFTELKEIDFTRNPNEGRFGLFPPAPG